MVPSNVTLPSPSTWNVDTGEVFLIPTLRFVVSTLNRLLAESTVRSSTTFKDWLKLPIPATVRFEPVPVRFSEPVMVSPDFRTLSDAAPVRVAVIVPAEKLPDASRRTAVLAIFVDWNVILPAFQILLPLIVTPSKFATVTSKVPEPSVALPPDAIMATL